MLYEYFEVFGNAIGSSFQFNLLLPVSQCGYTQYKEYDDLSIDNFSIDIISIRM